MKRNKILIILSLIFMLFCPIILTACSNSSNVSIVKIEKTDNNGLIDTYTIYYSNGTTTTFNITNGQDGEDSNITIDEVYRKYVEEYGDVSYADFLNIYFKNTAIDNSAVINQCLQTSLKVYTEFKVSYISGFGPYQQTIKAVEMSCGSAVIYKIESDYTYIITNYHVVYNPDANEDNGSCIASKIYGYLYGSEGAPTNSGTTENGYNVYNYGEYGIEFKYVGGSIDYDIAILKVETNKILNINENIKAVTFADEYYVGQTAIAIGNPENEGISATQGIVSVDNEYINLNIDNTTRSYRSIRIDTAIYGGSSGGGLFNAYGELIGVTNAGDNQNQNINYAIPVEIVKNVTENILRNYDGENPTEIKKSTLGITVTSEGTKYVYDATKGYGKIKENIIITNITEGSIAESLGLQVDDVIKSFSINGVTHSINRYFEIGDIVLSLTLNDEITVKYERNNELKESGVYVIAPTDLN